MSEQFLQAESAVNESGLDQVKAVIETSKLKNIIEAALLASGQPLSLDQLQCLFEEHERPAKVDIRQILDILQEDYAGRGFELKEVASGYRIQVCAEMQPWISKLWEERPPKYSRAFLETLAIIAYRQPITRGEIEDIRGVSVSSQIMKTLLERGWIRIVGKRDVPGRPSIYGTTKEFLSYFNLKSLDQLPSLMELRDITEINAELDLRFAVEEGKGSQEELEIGLDNQEQEAADNHQNQEDSSVE